VEIYKLKCINLFYKLSFIIGMSAQGLGINFPWIRKVLCYILIKQLRDQKLKRMGQCSQSVTASELNLKESPPCRGTGWLGLLLASQVGVGRPGVVSSFLAFSLLQGQVNLVRAQTAPRT
jgi:hypothetical protein